MSELMMSRKAALSSESRRAIVDAFVQATLAALRANAGERADLFETEASLNQEALVGLSELVPTQSLCSSSDV